MAQAAQGTRRRATPHAHRRVADQRHESAAGVRRGVCRGGRGCHAHCARAAPRRHAGHGARVRSRVTKPGPEPRELRCDRSALQRAFSRAPAALPRPSSACVMRSPRYAHDHHGITARAPRTHRLACGSRRYEARRATRSEAAGGRGRPTEARARANPASMHGAHLWLRLLLCRVPRKAWSYAAPAGRCAALPQHRCTLRQRLPQRMAGGSRREAAPLLHLPRATWTFACQSTGLAREL